MWPYFFVFIGTFLFDVVPFPFLPAFTVMVFLQVRYGLAVWPVLIIGVAGSVLGRYLLTLYIPSVSSKYFKPAKNEDIQYLGEQLKAKGWKSQLFILAYSLLPLPTTPLFLAGGMARISPRYLIPAFFVGKLISDSVAVLTGHYASQNIGSLRAGLMSWQSIMGLVGSGLLLGALLFIDWRSLLQKRRLVLNFRIFN